MQLCCARGLTFKSGLKLKMKWGLVSLPQWSSRLGFSAFTRTARVRFPVGEIFFSFLNLAQLSHTSFHSQNHITKSLRKFEQIWTEFNFKLHANNMKSCSRITHTAYQTDLFAFFNTYSVLTSSDFFTLLSFKFWSRTPEFFWQFASRMPLSLLARYDFHSVMSIRFRSACCIAHVVARV